MATHKKKRTKRYRGIDAKLPARPSVHHYRAVERGVIGRWWQQNRSTLKPLLWLTAVLGLIIWLLSVVLFGAF